MEVALQGSARLDEVVECGPAPHLKRTVSPTEALTAKGRKRKTPFTGATTTVWVVPLPLLPEEPP